MDLNPTDEQRALRSAANDFLAAAAAPARVAALADGASWDPAVWTTLAELGWLGISVPERLGGAELGLLEETIVFEEAGAALLPAPLLSTVGLALPALQASEGADDLVEALAAGELRATLAWADPDGERALSAAAEGGVRARGGRLTGRKVSVPDVDRVDLFVVVAAGETGVGLFAAAAADAEVVASAVPSLDGTATIGELELDGALAQPLVAGEAALRALASVWQRALSLAAAEAVGIAARVLEEAATYAGERQQFGRPIGSYQGVSHPLADAYVGLELSRSALIWAALSVDSGATDASVAVAAAAAKALPTAVRACEVAIQVHGGIGMTWESQLHRCYKRALALSALDGPASRQRARIADALLGPAG